MIWYLGLIFRHFLSPFIYFPYLSAQIELPLFTFASSSPVHSFSRCATMSVSWLHVCYANFSHSSSIRRASQEHLRFQLVFPQSFYPIYLFFPIRHDSTFATQTFLARHLLCTLHMLHRNIYGSYQFFILCPWNTILLQRSSLMYWMLPMASFCPGGLFWTIASGAIYNYL